MIIDLFRLMIITNHANFIDEKSTIYLSQIPNSKSKF